MSLAEEIKETNSLMEKRIGNHLLECMKTDELLANSYTEKKRTLKDCVKFIVKEARKYLNYSNGYIEDDVVYGWAKHYVLDEPVKTKPTESKSEIKVETKKVVKKEKPKKEEEPVISLFDFDYSEEG